MSKSSKKPVEGIVEKAWLVIAGSFSRGGKLHIILEEFPDKEHVIESFLIRIDKGERVRIWEEGSHPNIGGGGRALEILDDNGNTKFTVGQSGYMSQSGFYDYIFKIEDLK